MTIVESLEFGPLTVEIDDWGGVHYLYPDDHESPLSLSPKTMREIEQKRQEVIDD